MLFFHKKQENKEVTESNLICPRCVVRMENVKTEDGVVADVCPHCKSVIISRFDLDKTVVHFIKEEEKLI